MRGMTAEEQFDYIRALREEYRANVRAYEAEREYREKRASRKALEKKALAKRRGSNSALAEPWDVWYARIRKECAAQQRKLRRGSV